MKVLLLGSEGGMGRRYKAILDYLRIPYSCYDLKLFGSLEEASLGCDRAIIATPTNFHAESIVDVLRVLPGKPILCEKPIVKDILSLKDILSKCAEAKSDLRMVFQYRKVYKDDGMIGPSHYDFFRHGDDSLIWDCIQIIGLARGTVKLSESSPVWSCAINGQMLKLSLMDWAYIEYVNDWLKSPSLCVGPQEILEIHEKTARLANGTN